MGEASPNIGIELREDVSSSKGHPDEFHDEQIIHIDTISRDETVDSVNGDDEFPKRSSKPRSQSVFDMLLGGENYFDINKCINDCFPIYYRYQTCTF